MTGMQRHRRDASALAFSIALAGACAGEGREETDGPGVITSASGSASSLTGSTGATPGTTSASTAGDVGSETSASTTGAGATGTTLTGASSTSTGSTQTTESTQTTGAETAGQLDPCEGQGLEPIPASLLPLLDERVGFGENAVGGKDGCLYRVTNLNDAGPGSLREGAEREQALWIVFDIDGDIALNSEIRVTSNKTIDGRGAYIRIYDDGLHILDETHDVIVHNLIFKEDTSGADSDDAIRLMNDAHDVWIHHVSFSAYPDGLLDITRRSTDVTVSWCKFSQHNKVMLIGASPDHEFDDVIRVTLHHNWFRETTQRHPRLRYGKVHAFNNYYDSWGSYGAVSSTHGQLYSERNIYEAGDDKDAVLTIFGDDPASGDCSSVDDWALNGASVDEHNPDDVFKPSGFYAYQADEASATLRDAIESDAGWRDVPLP